MIRLGCKETAYTYDSYHLLKAFFPGEEICQVLDEDQEPLLSVEIEGGSSFCTKEPFRFTEETLGSGTDKRAVLVRLYEALRVWTGRELPWGVLTGVRPTKLALTRIEKGDSPAQAAAWMEAAWRVSPEKARLAAAVALREKEILEGVPAGGYNLYLGIPFCPSICAYCSFGSAPLERWRGRVDAYLDALCRELAFLGRKAAGRTLNTVYIGGGTPTTLEAPQLERLLGCLEAHFPMGEALEFTVEAGRPDSISRDKLKVLSRHGVSRISINPQTMHQETLDRIGRGHTVEAVQEAFLLAREEGFDNINMDLIAGLPGEGPQHMEETLSQIDALGPDSLTVHALAIKRAAHYGQHPIQGQEPQEVEEMIRLAQAYARGKDLLPYYLYRQKNIAGNFENVGFAKVDKPGIYNILVMEEKQTVLAAGAGASTKVVLEKPIPLSGGRVQTLVRVENAKQVQAYMSRLSEMCERKEKWLWR